MHSSHIQITCWYKHLFCTEAKANSQTCEVSAWWKHVECLAVGGFHTYHPALRGNDQNYAHSWNVVLIERGSLYGGQNFPALFGPYDQSFCHLLVSPLYLARLQLCPLERRSRSQLYTHSYRITALPTQHSTPIIARLSVCNWIPHNWRAIIAGHIESQ